MIAALLIAVSVLGFFVTVSITTMRMEMILYARTINAVRRFFGVKDAKMAKFLVLPTTDDLPPFFEIGRPMFWQIFLMGLIDGMITALAVNNLFKTPWWGSLFAGIVFIAVHLVVYYVFAKTREDEWTVRFPSPINIQSQL